MNLLGFSMLDFLPSLIIWTTAVAVVLGIFLHSLVRADRVPPSMEWAGRRNNFFGNVRACAREYTAGLNTIISGYKGFSRVGQPFILPTAGFEPQVMLPKEHIKWLIDQPEDVLSHRLVQGEKMGIRYVLPALDYTSDMSIIEAIRVHLTRNLGKVQGALVDEMRRATDATFGLDDQAWRQVNLLDTMNKIVFKASGRILFGQTLCRNERFMRCLLRFSTWFGMGGILTGQLVPWQFRRVIGSLFAIPVGYYRALCTAYLWPLFTERFQNMRRQRDDPNVEYTPPEDLITWMFRAAFDMKTTTIETPKPLASRFTVLVGGAIGSSGVIATNTLLDLLASDPQQRYYEILRNEAESAFPTENDWSQSAALLRLQRTDSAIRESLRRNPPMLTGLSRQVMPEEGVTLPSGQHVQQGAWIGFPVSGIHNDERFYDEPDVYTPFRFLPTGTTDEKISNNHGKAMLVTTSDTFLSFGHARHACPGRWFASHLLKLLLAYITMHYDIKPLQERPLNMVWGEHPIPPPQTSILVRRRKVAV